MANPVIFGEIPGIKEGQHFKGRKEMMENGFHRIWAAGIDGNRNEGVAAIVLNGGYIDDQDYGDEIIYTGVGGNSPSSKRQVDHQSWDITQNAGLKRSMTEGLPVRVIRGYKHKSPFSPTSGYVYAGLFRVTECWTEEGKDGYDICRMRLRYQGDNDHTHQEVGDIDAGKNSERNYRTSTTTSVVRDSHVARLVKAMHNYTCQVCGTTIKTAEGYKYAEGAHIRPISDPHKGADNLGNMLCLCPNHHVMLDLGIYSISDGYELLGEMTGKLNTISKHQIDPENLKYHRKSHGYDRT